MRHEAQNGRFVQSFLNDSGRFQAPAKTFMHQPVVERWSLPPREPYERCVHKVAQPDLLHFGEFVLLRERQFDMLRRDRDMVQFPIPFGHVEHKSSVQPSRQGVGPEIQSLCAERVSARFFNEVLEASAPTKPISGSNGNDKETLVSIVKEMTESMTGAQSTRHWAEDALWFDIPPFASRGIQPALKFFDKVFGSFQSCKIDILETDAVVTGNMGLVCTIQRVNVALKTGDAKRMVVRETDCFERRNGEWKLIHQHASVPAGGDWDGKITTT
jgi:ketosteroid isomerase-like protein